MIEMCVIVGLCMIIICLADRLFNVSLYRNTIFERISHKPKTYKDAKNGVSLIDTLCPTYVMVLRFWVPLEDKYWMDKEMCEWLNE